MSKVIIIVLIALGTACGLLMARPLPLARWLWPGPTVKGPGDVYVQAFQALACIVVLGLVALLASIAAFILGRRAGWPAGQWLSMTPVACGVVAVAVLGLTRTR
jgi:hypothetical protein